MTSDSLLIFLLWYVYQSNYFKFIKRYRIRNTTTMVKVNTPIALNVTIAIGSLVTLAIG